MARSANAGRETLDGVLKALADAKRVVLVLGAGVSTAAGLPDFRGSEGLYTRKEGKRKAQDLFSASLYRDKDTLEDFHRMVASFSHTAANAEPTTTHKFIQTLASKGKLVRVYSQNIDGLELRAGLKEAVSASGDVAKGGHVVQLHGSVHHVKCPCGYNGSLDEEMRECFSDGLAPTCPACEERAQHRSKAGKRKLTLLGGCGTLRPAMVLYDETYPPNMAESVAETLAADLRGQVDFVLVMGSSLTVYGIKKLIKDLAKRAHAKGRDKPRVILVNSTEVLNKEWNGVFDCHLRALCDDFSERALRAWRQTKPEDFMRQPVLTELTNVAIVKPTTSTAKAASKAASKPPVAAATRTSPRKSNPQRLPTPPTTSPGRALRRSASTTRV